MAEEVSKTVEENVEAKSNDNEAADHKTYSGKSFEDVDHFVNEDKQYLFRKTWMPKCEPKGLLMFLHGYSEHHYYYVDIAEAAVEVGMIVFAHDNVGHGESEGIRADVTRYEVYIRDALQHIKIMKEKYPHLPLYLCGHSKGAGIAIILAGENPDLFKGIILCAPVAAQGLLPTGAKLFILKLGSFIAPQKEVLMLSLEQLSRDPKWVENHKNDPLAYHGQMKLRMMVQLCRMSEKIWELIPQVTTPVLVQQGDKDGVCDITGAEELMNGVKSEDKTLKVYEGALHEPFHEIDDIPQRFFHDMKEWLQKHLSE